MLKTRFVELPGSGRVRMHRSGRGPTLLLLHGYPDDLQIWSRLVPLLQDHMDVIAFDWPGLGASDPLPVPGDFEAMSRALRDLMNVLHIEHARLLAFDVLGALGVYFARHHPESLDQLIVCNALVDPSAPTSPEIRLSRLGGYQLFLRLPRLAFWRTERTSLCDARLPADVREEMWTHFRRREVRLQLIRICSTYARDASRITGWLEGTPVPVLVLWAEQDRHFPLAQARAAAQAARSGSLCVVPGGRHWMMWERPEVVARKLLDATGMKALK